LNENKQLDETVKCLSLWDSS